MSAGRKTESKIIIDKFLGINETDGGQTVLKNGESPYMRNFCIDRNGKLRKRFGWEKFFSVSKKTIDAVCRGTIDGEDMILFSAGTRIYRFYPSDMTYTLETSLPGNGEYLKMLFWKDKFYFFTNNTIYKYDGNKRSEATGYIPCVKTNTKPNGSGIDGERLNVISGYRRQLFSPDGNANTFCLNENEFKSIVYVGINGTKETSYSANPNDGRVSFNTVPEAGTNTLEIIWESAASYTANQNLAIFKKMRNASVGIERVFMWGNPDCPNRLYWCGIGEDGAGMDYLCDDCSALIGNGRYAITDVIQHYDKIVIFTEGDAWCATIKEKTDGGQKHTEFNIWPINKDKGLKIINGAQLINNNIFSVMPEGVYEWTSTNMGDERNARLISQRVSKTLSGRDMSAAVTFDDESAGEYWLAFPDGVCVIYNYRADVWYIYDGIPAKQFFKIDERVYFLSTDGVICRFTEEYTDNGNPIKCEWQMNFEGFGSQGTSKNLLRAYVGLEPETHANYRLKWQTDSDCSEFYSDEPIEGGYAFFGYDNIQYDAFSYDTLYAPKIFRHRLMLKRFSYVKLYIDNDRADKGCTLVCLALEGYRSGEPKEQF